MGSPPEPSRDSTSDCPSSAALRQYLTDAASAAQAAELENHMGNCPVCLQRLERFSADDELDRCKGSRRRIEQEQTHAVTPRVQTESAVGIDGNRSSEEHNEALRMMPQTLGRYRLERFLGRGGFGVVYLAVDTLLERRVALKLATTSTSLDPALRQRFVAEARIAAQLRHRHIVPVYEAGELDGQCFFASEYIPGPTLAERLADGEPLPFAEAALLVAGIADAVQHAHEHGIVHRDIKPSNILLDAREKAIRDSRPGRVAAVAKLADFGLAKAIEGDGDLRTQTGMILGTPAYMAPEQALAGGGAAGPATDVYALGATLYAALVGRPPISGGNAIETLQRAATETPTRPRNLRREAPRDLEAICMKCLEKTPRLRYATARALADDLRRFLAGQPTLARPASTAESMWRFLRRHPRSAGSAAAVAAALVTFIVVLATLNLRLEQALEHAQTNQEYAQQLLYASDVRLANAALREGDLTQFAELMGRHIPSMGSRDLRGFEWHALVRRTSVDQHVLQHSDQPLYCVRQSTAGDLLATAGADGQVRVWELATGRLRRTISAGQGEVNGVCFSPDGKTLAAAGDDGSVGMWDVTTGELRLRIEAHDTVAYGVAFLRDGTELASCGNEATIRLWDVASGDALGTFEGHSDSVQAIVASAQATVLASVSDDGSAIVWDLDTRRPRQRLQGHENRINCLALSADGATLVTGGQDGTLRKWNLASGNGQLVGEHLDALLAVAFLPGERQVAACDRSGLTRLHLLAERDRNDFGRVSQPSVYHRLSHEWTERTDLRSRWWNLAPNRILWWDVTPDDRQILIVTSTGAFVRELPAGRMTNLPPRTAYLVEHWQQAMRDDARPEPPIDLSADGLTWLCGNELYEADAAADAGWRFVDALEECPERLAIAALSPEGDAAALIRTDGAAALWRRDASRAWSVRPLSGAECGWRRVEFAPDGKRLAAVDGESHIHLWDVATGERVARLMWQGSPVTSLTFLSPDLLVLGDAAGRLSEWEAPAKTLRRTFQAHTGPILCLSVAPGGRELATYAEHPDHTRALWEVGSWKRLATISNYRQPNVFSHIAFFATGWHTGGERVCVVTDRNGLAAIPLSTPASEPSLQLTSYRAHQGRAYSCVAIPDGSLATVGEDGRIVRATFAAEAARSLLDVSAIDFAPSGGSRLAVVTTEQETVEIDAVDGRVVRTLTAAPARMATVGYCAVSQSIVAITEDGLWRMWSDDGQCRETHISGEARSLKDCSFSGLRLAFASYDAKQIAIVHSESRRVVREFDAKVRGDLAAFSPDDRTLYANWEDTVIAWDVASGEKRHVLQGHRDGVHALAVSADGTKVATGGGERSVVLWDAATGTMLQRFVGHRTRVSAICFSPDGRSLATGDEAGAIKIWQLATGRELLQLDDRQRKVVKMVFTSDGARLVVLSRGYELIAYDVSPVPLLDLAQQSSAGISPR